MTPTVRPVLAILLTLSLMLVIPTASAQYRPDQLHVTVAGTPSDAQLQPPEATHLVVHWSVERPYLPNHQPQVRYTVDNGTQSVAAAQLVGMARDFSPPTATEENDATPIYAARIFVPRGSTLTYQAGEPSGGFSEARTVKMLPDLVFNATIVATGSIGTDGYSRLGQRVPTLDAPQERAFQLALNQSPDLALFLGNLAYSTSSKPWNGFMRSSEMLQSRVATIPVPGDADTDSDFHHIRERYVLPYAPSGGTANANQPQERLDHGFSVGPAYFIGINSPGLCSEAQSALPDVPPCTEGAPDAAKLSWIHDILEDAREDLGATWIVLYMHHSPYVYADDGNHLPTNQLVAPLLDAYSVDLVLTGGEQIYQRSHPIRAGVAVTRDHQDRIPAGLGPVYVVTANPSDVDLAPITDLYPPWLAVSNSTPHITRIEVTLTTLTVTAIATHDGSILDQFTIYKPGSSSDPGAEPSPTQPARRAPFVEPALIIAALLFFLVRRRTSGGNV